MATRQVTVNEYMNEYIVSVLERWARERGDDVEIVPSRPKPRLVQVIPLPHRAGDKQESDNGNE